MKIGIIGAGYVGLSAGYKLSKDKNQVTIFEKSNKPGGLASGFRLKNWDWELEEHYHHWFSSDDEVKKLAKDVGHNVSFFRPKTSVVYDEEIYQLDSPLSLLKFPHLKYVDRVRTGLVLAYLKFTPYWKNLEKITTRDFLIRYMGIESWKILWEPLMVGKFGKYAEKIPASWFWARIKKRTASLGYPKGGFESFAKHIAEEIGNNDGEIKYGIDIEKIKKVKSGIEITYSKGTKEIFDRVICTLPVYAYLKITTGLPAKYVNSLKPLKGIGAITVVLILKKSYFDDGTYWLSVNDLSYPFLAVVEHTNFIDSANYGGDVILYVGNYKDVDHKYFKMSESEIVDEYLSGLKRINPKFNKSWTKEALVFKTPFAQPIVPLNYSKNIPSITTPIKGLYIANMQQVYPWDRGTNYAVELGNKVADIVMKK